MSRTSILTAIAVLVIFGGAGVAVALMFPGASYPDPGRVAVFAGLVVVLAGLMFTRARRRSRESGR